MKKEWNRSWLAWSPSSEEKSILPFRVPSDEDLHDFRLGFKDGFEFIRCVEAGLPEPSIPSVPRKSDDESFYMLGLEKACETSSHFYGIKEPKPSILQVSGRDLGKGILIASTMGMGAWIGFTFGGIVGAALGSVIGMAIAASLIVYFQVWAVIGGIISIYIAYTSFVWLLSRK